MNVAARPLSVSVAQSSTKIWRAICEQIAVERQTLRCEVTGWTRRSLIRIAGTVCASARRPAFADVTSRRIIRIGLTIVEALGVKVEPSVYAIVCISDISGLGTHVADYKTLRRPVSREVLGNRITRDHIDLLWTH